MGDERAGADIFAEGEGGPVKMYREIPFA